MITAIIAAGGSGLRMKADVRKQYLLLDNVPILTRSLFPFDDAPQIDRIIMTVPEGDLAYCKNNIVGPYPFKKKIEIIKGGRDRQASVFEGLKAAHGSRIVLIHDGVRPFVTREIIDACLLEVKHYGACITAIPAIDTLKQLDRHERVIGTIERKKIWMAQTPQCFDYNLIYDAHRAANEKRLFVTDDAALIEKMGKPISVVEGSRCNMKITTPEDLKLAIAVMAVHAEAAQKEGEPS